MLKSVEERMLAAQSEIAQTLEKYGLEFAWTEDDDGEMLIVLEPAEEDDGITLQ